MRIPQVELDHLTLPAWGGKDFRDDTQDQDPLVSAEVNVDKDAQIMLTLPFYIGILLINAIHAVCGTTADRALLFWQGG